MRLRTDGEGPLVVKVAGLVGGVGLYQEEVARARAAGFRVAALDTSGDRADDPASGPLRWTGLADEVAQALDRLEAPDAVLWGTSFGCLVCLAAATRHPDRVAGLLLCVPPEPGWQPRPYRRLFRWTSSRRRPARATARGFRLGFTVLNAWEFLLPSALVRLPGLVRASKDASTPDTTVLQKLQLLWGDHPGVPRGRDLPPGTIIAGALDPVAPVSGARRLAASLGGLRLRILRFGGHSVAYSRPRIYSRWVIEELDRLTRDAPVSNPVSSEKA